MVGLDYVSDQKHLTAVNSMTVVSMIYFCDITTVSYTHLKLPTTSKV